MPPKGVAASKARKIATHSGCGSYETVGGSNLSVANTNDIHRAVGTGVLGASVMLYSAIIKNKHGAGIAITDTAVAVARLRRCALLRGSQSPLGNLRLGKCTIYHWSHHK